jgi:hypothetical protein
MQVGEPRELGVADGARLRFSSPKRQTPEGPRFNSRQLLLDDAAAFELSFWCRWSLRAGTTAYASASTNSDSNAPLARRPYRYPCSTSDYLPPCRATRPATTHTGGARCAIWTGWVCGPECSHGRNPSRSESFGFSNREGKPEGPINYYYEREL